MPMKVYAIIVTYNASKWIAGCLDSLANSATPVTIVMIDNQSSDDTVIVAQNHKANVNVIQNKQNLGFGKANNLGLSYAIKNNADYIFLINQDARIRPDTINSLIKVSAQNPEYYVLSPLHLAGNEAQLDLNFSSYAGPDFCAGLFSDSLIKKQDLKMVYETRFVNAALWLLPIACLLKIGGFDPLFAHYGEDDDLINRIYYHGYKVGICPYATGIHDRPQIPFNIDDLDLNKKLARKKSGFLIPLKNINKPFFKELFKAYGTVGKDIILKFFELNFKEAWMNVKLFFFILLRIHLILHNRELSKKLYGTQVWFYTEH
jgi:GT2 family glycosyltransferase